MSAWHKQAIPLRFVEVFCEAMDIHCSGTRLKAIRKRIDRWVEDCWATIPGGRREKDISVQKKAAKIFTNLKKYVHEGWYPGEDVEYPPAICAGMLAVVDDAFFDLPKKAKDRQYVWGWLRKAMIDLAELTDPDLADTKAQYWGARLADRLREEIRA